MNKTSLQAVRLAPSVIEYLSLENRLQARKAAPISRDELERKLARAILAIERRYLSILENSGGAIPFNYWTEYEAELRQQIASPLRAQIEQSFSNYSDYVNFIDQTGAVSDIDTAMTRAIDEVAQGVANNSRLQFENLISQGVSQDEIIERMALRFSSGHAEQIAVTELTRAEAHFSDALAARLSEQSVSTQIRLNAAEDEKMCPIRGAADGKLKEQPIKSGTLSKTGRMINAGSGWSGQSWGERFGNPPFHPNCRCQTVVELRKDSNA